MFSLVKSPTILYKSFTQKIEGEKDLKYPHFIHKSHGKYAINIEDFDKNIETYLSKVQRYLEQNKNNKVDFKLKIWRDFYNGDDFVEYMAEEHGMSKRAIYAHLDSVTSILKRHPDCRDMWRKI